MKTRKKLNIELFLRPIVALFLIYCINLPALALFNYSDQNLIAQNTVTSPSPTVNHNSSIFNATMCSSTSGSADFSFKSSSFSISSTISSHATSDINRDSNTDLFLLPSTTPAINIFLGDGKGAFSTSTPKNTNSLTSFANIYDINDDGFKDILLLSKASNSFSVLLSDDNLNFFESISFGGLNSPSQVLTGDVNNDGFTDSFVLDKDALYLYINFGDSDIYSFGFPLSLPFIPKSFSLADLNYDGNLDIVCPDPSSSQLVVLYGNGFAEFSSQFTIPTNGIPSSIQIADLNNDNKLDLIASVLDKVAVSFGNSSNRFDNPIYSNLPSKSLFIGVGNFNGDCLPDIISVNDNKTFSLIKNNGNKSFSPSIEFSLSSNPISFSVVNLNNDSKSDLVLSFPNEVKIYLGSEPENTSTTAPTSCVGGKPICPDNVAPSCLEGGNPVCGKIGDSTKYGCLVNGMIILDKVSCPKLASSSSSSGSNVVSNLPTNCVSGKPTCSSNANAVCISGGTPICGKVGDGYKYGCLLNGKISFDAVTCQANSSSTSSSSGSNIISSSSSSGSLMASSSSSSSGSASKPSSSSGSTVVINTSSSSSGSIATDPCSFACTSVPFGNTGFYNSFNFDVDINGDGNPDRFTKETYGDLSLTINGNKVILGNIGSANITRSICSADFDKDGFKDLLVTKATCSDFCDNNAFAWIKNNKNASYTLMSIITSPLSRISSFKVDDFNNDSKVDIFSTIEFQTGKLISNAFVTPSLLNDFTGTNTCKCQCGSSSSGSTPTTSCKTESSSFMSQDGGCKQIETGLIWGPSKSIEGYQAASYCQDLIANTFDDWRLPSFNELYTLLNFNQLNLQLPVTLWSNSYVTGNSQSINTVMLGTTSSVGTGNVFDTNTAICIRGDYYNPTLLTNSMDTMCTSFVGPVESASLSGDLNSDLVSADFDNDGIKDICAVQSTSISQTATYNTTVNFLKGDKSNFANPIKSTYADSGFIVQVKAEDLNNDSNKDIVLVTSKSNTYEVKILTGQGNGRFNTPITLSGIFSIELTDINNDNLNDIVGLGPSNKVISYLNNGNLSFSKIESTTSVTGTTNPVSVGDFNKDGLKDLAIVSPSKGNVTILKGNSSGTFTDLNSYVTAVNSSLILNADFNNDGNLDILTASNGGSLSSGEFSLLLGNGDASFKLPKKGLVGVVNKIVKCNINNDSFPDVAAIYANGNFGVWASDGQGNLSNNAGYYYEGKRLQSFTLSDFDNDGLDDVAYLTDQGSRPVYLIWNKTTCQPSTSSSSGCPPTPSCPTVTGSTYTDIPMNDTCKLGCGTLKPCNALQGVLNAEGNGLLTISGPAIQANGDYVFTGTSTQTKIESGVNVNSNYTVTVTITPTNESFIANLTRVKKGFTENMVVSGTLKCPGNFNTFVGFSGDTMLAVNSQNTYFELWFNYQAPPSTSSSSSSSSSSGSPLILPTTQSANPCKLDDAEFKSSNGGCKHIQTGYVFNKPLNDVDYNQSYDFCENLTVEGFDDWKLISDPEYRAVSGDAAIKHFSFDTFNRFFLSIGKITQDTTITDIMLSDGPGYLSSSPSTTKRTALCVRKGTTTTSSSGTPTTSSGSSNTSSSGNQSSPIVCKKEDGTFKSLNGGCQNIATNLVWSTLQPTATTQTNAISYCNNLILNGYDDWTLPDALQITDVALRYAPDYFNFNTNQFFWSSSVNSNTGVIASLSNTSQYLANANTSYPVVCVRTAPAQNPNMDYDPNIYTEPEPGCIIEKCLFAERPRLTAIPDSQQCQPGIRCSNSPYTQYYCCPSNDPPPPPPPSKPKGACKSDNSSNFKTQFGGCRQIIPNSAINYVWSGQPTIYPSSFSTISNYCSNLVESGKDDWYLPTSAQLKNLAGLNPSNYIYVNPNTYYWSATGELIDPSTGFTTTAGTATKGLVCVRNAYINASTDKCNCINGQLTCDGCTAQCPNGYTAACKNDGFEVLPICTATVGSTTLYQPVQGCIDPNTPPPNCSQNDWSCSAFNECSTSTCSQSRNCSLLSNTCLNPESVKPATTRACSPTTFGKSWTFEGSLPQGVFNSEAVVFNGKIFVIGGRKYIGTTSSEAINKVYVSSDGANWQEAKNQSGQDPLPEGLSYHSAVVFKNKIWSFGGNNSASSVSNKIYSSTDGSNWITENAVLPVSVYAHRVVEFNNKLYLIGGSVSGTGISKQVYSSVDGLNWVREIDLSSAVTGHSATLLNNKILIFGGYILNSAGSSVQNSSTQALAIGTQGLYVSPVSSSFVYLNGEYEDTVIADNKIWYLHGNKPSYSADGLAWFAVPVDFPNIAWRYSAVFFNNKLFIIGGLKGPANNQVITGEVYSTKADPNITITCSTSSSSSGSSTTSSSSSGALVMCTSGSICPSGQTPNCPTGTVSFICLSTQEPCCLDSMFNCFPLLNPTCKTSSSSGSSTSSSSSGNSSTNTTSSSSGSSTISSSSSGTTLMCSSGTLCPSGQFPNCPSGTSFTCVGPTQIACCIDSNFNCIPLLNPTCKTSSSSGSSTTSNSSGNFTCSQASDCQIGMCANGTTYQKYNCTAGACIQINYLVDPCSPSSTSSSGQASSTCIASQWASSVTATNSYSSASANYPASNIVGAPDCTAYATCSGNRVWLSATAGQPANVEVTFSTPTLANSILIKEAFYSGFIKSITLKDQNNNTIGSPISVTDMSTSNNYDLIVSFPKTSTPVSKVLIETVPVSSSSYSCIDAVQISCSSATSTSSSTSSSSSGSSTTSSSSSGSSTTQSSSSSSSGNQVPLNLSFSAQTPISVTDVNRSIQTFDYDKDGKQDIILIQANSRLSTSNTYSQYSLIMGSGNGSFSSPTYTSLQPFAIPSLSFKEDFNNDGDQDLIIGSSAAEFGLQDYNLFSLDNNNSAFNVIGTIGAGITDVSFADINLDGKKDLVGIAPNNQIVIFNGSNNGTFTSSKIINLGRSNAVSGYFSPKIATGKFNNDNYTDIAIIYPNYDSISVLLGGSNSTFGQETYFSISKKPFDLEVKDINQDGKLDIITVNDKITTSPPQPCTLSVLLGQGNGSFNGAITTLLGDGNFNGKEIQVEDYNNDSKPDVAILGRLENKIYVLKGDGLGSFSNPLTYAFSNLNDQSVSISSSDFNADGKLDIAVATTNNTANNERVTVFLNSSTPISTSTPSITSLSATSGPAVTPIMINGSNFSNVTAVKFGNIPTTFTVNSPTLITAPPPVGTGTVAVTVTNYAGTSSPVNFTYTTESSSSGSSTSTSSSSGTPQIVLRSATYNDLSGSRYLYVDFTNNTTTCKTLKVKTVSGTDVTSLVAQSSNVACQGTNRNITYSGTQLITDSLGASVKLCDNNNICSNSVPLLYASCSGSSPACTGNATPYCIWASDGFSSLDCSSTYPKCKNTSNNTTSIGVGCLSNSTSGSTSSSGLPQLPPTPTDNDLIDALNIGCSLSANALTCSQNKYPSCPSICSTFVSAKGGTALSCLRPNNTFEKPIINTYAADGSLSTEITCNDVLFKNSLPFSAGGHLFYLNGTSWVSLPINFSLGSLTRIPLTTILPNGLASRTLKLCDGNNYNNCSGTISISTPSSCSTCSTQTFPTSSSSGSAISCSGASVITPLPAPGLSNKALIWSQANNSILFSDTTRLGEYLPSTNTTNTLLSYSMVYQDASTQVWNDNNKKDVYKFNYGVASNSSYSLPTFPLIQKIDANAKTSEDILTINTAFGGISNDSDYFRVKDFLRGTFDNSRNKIYFFGSNRGTSFPANDILEFDINSRVITKKNAKFTTTRNAVGVSFDKNRNLIYIFGGCDPASVTSYKNEIFEYNPATDTLTKKNAVLPSARGFVSATFNPYNNKFYLIGGPGSTTKEIISYNPLTDTIENTGLSLQLNPNFYTTTTISNTNENGKVYIDEYYSVGYQSAFNELSFCNPASTSSSGGTTTNIQATINSATLVNGTNYLNISYTKNFTGCATLKDSNNNNIIKDSAPSYNKPCLQSGTIVIPSTDLVTLPQENSLVKLCNDSGSCGPAVNVLKASCTSNQVTCTSGKLAYCPSSYPTKSCSLNYPQCCIQDQNGGTTCSSEILCNPNVNATTTSSSSSSGFSSNVPPSGTCVCMTDNSIACTGCTYACPESYSLSCQSGQPKCCTGGYNLNGVNVPLSCIDYSCMLSPYTTSSSSGSSRTSSSSSSGNTGTGITCNLGNPVCPTGKTFSCGTSGVPCCNYIGNSVFAGCFANGTCNISQGSCTSTSTSSSTSSSSGSQGEPYSGLGQCSSEDNLFKSLDGGCKDIYTGLVWSQPSIQPASTVLFRCLGFGQGSFTDWRPPTIEELNSFYNRSGLSHLSYISLPSGALENIGSSTIEPIDSSNRTVKTLVPSTGAINGLNLSSYASTQLKSLCVRQSSSYNINMCDSETSTSTTLSNGCYNSSTMTLVTKYRKKNFSDTPCLPYSQVGTKTTEYTTPALFTYDFEHTYTCSMSYTPETNTSSSSGSNSNCGAEGQLCCRASVTAEGTCSNGLMCDGNNNRCGNQIHYCALTDERFSIIDGGCKDTTVGVVWSKLGPKYTSASSASTYCTNNREGGFSDWRLPEAGEVTYLGYEGSTHFGFPTTEYRVLNSVGSFVPIEIWTSSIYQERDASNRVYDIPQIGRLSNGSITTWSSSNPNSALGYNTVCVRKTTATSTANMTTTCTDSDNGADYLVRGVTKSSKESYSYTDSCILNSSGGQDTPVSSCEGNNCYLNEYTCNGNNERSTEKKACAECSNGRCKLTTINTSTVNPPTPKYSSSSIKLYELANTPITNGTVASANNKGYIFANVNNTNTIFRFNPSKNYSFENIKTFDSNFEIGNGLLFGDSITVLGKDKTTNAAKTFHYDPFLDTTSFKTLSSPRFNSTLSYNGNVISILGGYKNYQKTTIAETALNFDGNNFTEDNSLFFTKVNAVPLNGLSPALILGGTDPNVPTSEKDIFQYTNTNQNTGYGYLMLSPDKLPVNINNGVAFLDGDAWYRIIIATIINGKLEFYRYLTYPNVTFEKISEVDNLPGNINKIIGLYKNENTNITYIIGYSSSTNKNYVIECSFNAFAGQVSNNTSSGNISDQTFPSLDLNIANLQTPKYCVSPETFTPKYKLLDYQRPQIAWNDSSKKMYVLGGLMSNPTTGKITSTNSILEYDSTNNILIYKSEKLPYELSDGSATYFPDNNNIYIFGGASENYDNANSANNRYDQKSDIIEYNLSSRTFKTVKYLSQRRTKHSTIYAPNTKKIYIIGGVNTDNNILSHTPQIIEYDPLTNTAAQKGSIDKSNPETVYCPKDGRIYIIGGNSTSNVNSAREIIQYVPSTGGIAKKSATIPNAVNNVNKNITAFWNPVIERIVIGTISDGAQNHYPRFYAYNPVTDTITPLCQSLYYHTPTYSFWNSNKNTGLIFTESENYIFDYKSN